MPYNPRGRGRIEHYHKTLHQGLIALKEFRSLWLFKARSLEFRPLVQQLAQAGDPGRVDSASIYHKINFNKHRKITKSGQKLCQQNRH